MIELHDIPWHELHHAYGTATDIPDHVTELRSPDPAARARA